MDTMNAFFIVMLVWYLPTCTKAQSAGSANFGNPCSFNLTGLASLPECGPAPAPGRPDKRFACWKFYGPPKSGMQFLPEGGGIRLWVNDSKIPVSNGNTVIYLNLPAECVSKNPCVEVKGVLSSQSLSGTRLFLQQELFTGFPGARPALHNCSRGPSCCYDPKTVAPCVNSPYGKPCLGLLASGIALQPASIAPNPPHTSSYNWQYELTSSYVNFDKGSDHAPLHPSEFSLMVDYEGEKYRNWRIGNHSWSMDQEIGIYEPDENCVHIQAWVPAEFEFNLRLLPVSSDTPMRADVTLSSLDVVLHQSCTPQQQHPPSSSFVV